MQLYLVRHGDATSKSENRERPLTKLGRSDARKLAAYLARHGVHPTQIRHSGKARAKETAEIIGAALKPEGGVVQVPGLKPNDDVRTITQSLWDESETIMLVSHLPLLERLSSLLLAGDAERSVIQFRKCSVAALVKDENGWRLNWTIFPSLIS